MAFSLHSVLCSTLGSPLSTFQFFACHSTGNVDDCSDILAITTTKKQFFNNNFSRLTHDLDTANGTGVAFHIPRPHRNGIPFFQCENILRLSV